MSKQEALLELRQAIRLRMLQHVYERTDASTKVEIAIEVMFQHLSLTPEGGARALEYLIGEALLAPAEETGGVFLTHQGLVEAEEALQGRETRRFRPSAVHQVTHHFHAPVGGVQTGIDARASVNQVVGTTPQEERTP